LTELGAVISRPGSPTKENAAGQKGRPPGNLAESAAVSAMHYFQSTIWVTGVVGFNPLSCG
jgi:hypothetical protein